MKVDHRSYRRKFCSCEKKAWKKNQACTVLEPLTSTIPVQRSYHIITLKNPRDRTGMRALTLQAFPDSYKQEMEIFSMYTQRPFGYMMMDLHPASDYPFWLWTNITQEDGSPIVYNRTSWGNDRSQFPNGYFVCQ